MRLREDLTEYTVGSLPLREPVSVQPGTPVRAAVAQMQEQKLGCAVLVDQDNKPTGMFTERTLLGLLTQGRSLDESRVDDFLDNGFLAVSRDQAVSTVWNAVVKDGARFICVTDNDGKLLGLTGQRGLAEHVAECCPQQVMVQRLGGKPWMQQQEGA